MRSFFLPLAIWSLCLFQPSEAFAHARLLGDGTTPPRNSNAGLKTGPCGGVARTNSSTTLRAGDTLVLQWEEIIDHPGRFEFYISEQGDQNFKLIKTVEDTQNNKMVPHSYTTTITVPNTPCSACTLQMIQVMTENPANPRNYYSCADIEILAPEMPMPPNPDPGNDLGDEPAQDPGADPGEPPQPPEAPSDPNPPPTEGQDPDHSCE